MEAGCVGAPTWLRAVMRSGGLEGGYVGAPTNIFAATFHIGGCSSIHNPRTCHAVVTDTHLSRLYCILWWIYCNKWFRRCIVSMCNKQYCFLSSWYVSFLGSSGKVTYHASNFHWKFCVLKALQLSVGLKDMYNSCFQVYCIYMDVKTPDYT